MRKPVSTLTEGRGAGPRRFFITADRGYGKEPILKFLMESGIGSMLIMVEYILRAHPFVGKSFLDPLRYDVEEDNKGMNDAVIALRSGNGSNAHKNGNKENCIRENEVQEVSRDQERQGSSSALPPICNDRGRAFIVDDSPDLGPAFFAMKRVRQDGSRAVSNDKMTAIAIREHGSDKFAKVIWFFYNVPRLINENLRIWIAVPKGCI